MESTLDRVNRQIKYYQAREKRQVKDLRTVSTPALVLAEMRLEHTRELVHELREIRKNLLWELNQEKEETNGG